MEFLELAKARYSLRAYADKPVEEEKLAKILEAGRVAPTAANLQPQRVYVLRSKEALEKINSVCKCIFGAPQVLVVCYDDARVWKNPIQSGYNSGEVDCAIVCTHMMLAAKAEGIGSCWVRFFNADEVAAALGLPAGVVPVAILPFGYPAEGAGPNEKMHNSFRPAEETVFYM